MELSQEQKAKISEWVEAGASLGEVQRRLREEFGVQMTYMEVRLLVLDIGAAVKDKPEPRAQQPATRGTPDGGAIGDGLDADAPAPAGDGFDAAMGGAPAPEGDVAWDDGAGQDADPAGGPGAPKVSVELDKIVRAGAAMSGAVTFSDGVTGSWVLDRYGRLGLTKVSKPGYQPTAQDLQAFQIELQRKLGY